MKRMHVNFEAEVIERSRHTPVLVDFWAPWCGPCKMLGPVVEKLAAEADGRWRLVKVNVDEQPELAAQFGIRGIPNLKLFHRGSVVGDVAGALPEAQLSVWIAQHLPTPKRDAMARARQLILSGHATEAVHELRALAAAEPQDEELAVLTARAMVFSKPLAAVNLVAPIAAASPWHEGAHVVQVFAAALARVAQPMHDLANPVLRERYADALHALGRQEFRAAAAGLIGVLEQRPEYDDGRARATCRALFHHLGMRHPITEEFSRAYSMAVHR